MKATPEIIEQFIYHFESIPVSGKIAVMIDASGRYVDFVVETRDRLVLATVDKLGKLKDT